MLLGAIFGLQLCVTSPAFAFRCGPGLRLLASEGMHKQEILKDCGPPASREIVGVDEDEGSHRIIEEWVYVIDERGHQQVYLVKFDSGNMAVGIEWLGEKK
jgi:hypothetical protein